MYNIVPKLTKDLNSNSKKEIIAIKNKYQNIYVDDTLKNNQSIILFMFKFLTILVPVFH